MELNNHIHQQDPTLMESNDIHNQPDEILDESPHPLPPPPVVVALLSYGNILEQFPEFLIHVLSYIPDRTVWNSIASCNQDMYEKSKAYLPPWPTNYKLNCYSEPRIAVWSPCGTKIACTTHDSKIFIFGQQHGPILHGDGNEFGWIAHHGVYNNINDLKFSPDGRFLVSADQDGIVRLWDSTTGGDYEQLQGTATTRTSRRAITCASVCTSACMRPVRGASSAQHARPCEQRASREPAK